MRIKFKRKKGKFEYLDNCRVLNFFSLGGFLLRKKSEKCIAFLVPSLHCKLALFRVPYALRATFIPSLRFGTGCASPYNPCHCLKLKNSKLNHLLFSGIHYKKNAWFYQPGIRLSQLIGSYSVV